MPVASPAVSLDTIRALVDAAAHAPSGDNCQPWRFHWDGGCLRVLFEPERAESFYDVAHAASWVSLGAVLVNLRVAAERAGLRLLIERFPAGEPAGAVAVVRLESTAAGGRCERLAVVSGRLIDAVYRRCANRRPYDRAPLPASVRDELVAAAGAVPGVRLSWIDEPRALARVAAIAAENERFLFEHRGLHDGLYRWLRWTPDDAERTRDGMPVGALELSLPERAGMKALASWRLARLAAGLGLGRLTVLRSARVYARAGAVALLSVAGRSPEHFVRAGEALQQVWLAATLRDVAVQPLAGVTFLLARFLLGGVDELSPCHRARLGRLRARLERSFPAAAAETPVMLLRLGRAPAPSARALRRRASELLAVEDGRG